MRRARTCLVVSSTLLIGAALTLMLSACSSSPPSLSAAMVNAVQQARDRVCQCADQPCAQAAHEAYRGWKRTPASLHRRELTAAQAAQLGQLEVQMQLCVAALKPAVPVTPSATATP